MRAHSILFLIPFLSPGHEQGDHIFLNEAHMHDIYAAANLANTALALPDIDI